MEIKNKKDLMQFLGMTRQNELPNGALMYNDLFLAIVQKIADQEDEIKNLRAVLVDNGLYL